jgi:hypothetical protein
MRITLTLDDDVVAEAKAIAKERGTALGRVISDLALQSLPLTRNGFRVFPARSGGPKIDMEFVNRLRDDLDDEFGFLRYKNGAPQPKTRRRSS